MKMIEFRNDDESYLAWITARPGGFVLNVRRVPDPGYVVLHRAGCHTISSGAHTTGAYTARGYRKFCAEIIDELKRAAASEGRSDGSFSKKCGVCRP